MTDVQSKKVWVIGAFAPKFARLVYAWLVNISGEIHFDVELLPGDLTTGDEEPRNKGIVLFKGGWKSAHAVPLVVCESRGELKRMGVLCPYEFVIERSDLLPIVNDEWKKKFKDGQDAGGNEKISAFLSNPVDELKNRMRCLLARYPGGKTEDELRDWFAGLFRRYICLDETVHGTSNLIDLDKLLTDSLSVDNPLLADICLEAPKTSDGKRFHARFRGAGDKADAMYRCRDLLTTLYGHRIAEVSQAFTPFNDDKIESGQKQVLVKRNLIRLFWKCRDQYKGCNPYPRPLGDRAKYVTPTGRIDVLVIDDEPEDITDRIKNGKTQGNGSVRQRGFTICDELFNFQPLKIVADSKANVFEVAKEAFNRIRERGLSYDLVLVDLCLGDETGGDLSGYRMIRFVKQFFPDVPVVVYSKFRDMDHIARAFECGARWFLVKGEEDKLPRHVLRMLKQSGWHREWRAAQNHFKPIFLPQPGIDSSEFVRAFHRREDWKYLTYKSLEFYPGRFVSVKQMGGGISSAVTFKAVKGIMIDGEYLQSPSIIKIDSAHNATMEFERYFRYVRPYIANQVGRVERPARILDRGTASIVYTFAGHPDSEHSLDSMANALAAAIRHEVSCDYERFRKALDEVFDEILPSIHRITPSREFGNADDIDCHSGVVEPSEPKYSAYPNASFNEYRKEEFYKSYVLRMQPWWTIEMSDGIGFEPQPLFNDALSDPPKGLTNCFVFHDIFRDHDRYVIEAYDTDCRLGWLTGLTADHVARYRRVLSPGKTLWVADARLSGTDRRTDLRRPFRNRWLKDRFGEDPSVDILRLIPEMGANAEQGCLDIQDDLLCIAEKVGKALAVAKDTGGRVRVGGCEFSSPVGIVHGDLNFGNVMLESRRQTPPPDRPDEHRRLSDVWLIDFARTRRDLIVHDFNVAFTSTLALLVEKSLFDNAGYRESLERHFSSLVRLSFTEPSENLSDIPDEFAKMPRFALVYRILRRIRSAALAAGVSEHMYLLTSALACAYTFKIFLNRKRFIETSAMLAAMKTCYVLLRKDIVDDELKAKLQYRGAPFGTSEARPALTKMGDGQVHA